MTETLRGLLTRPDDPDDDEAKSDSDDESEATLPDHEFDIKETIIKSGKKKGTRVSLSIGNYMFRRRRELQSGRVTFSCNECETEGKFISATAEVVDGQYRLVEAPKPEEHCCWASGNALLIKQARSMMYQKVEEDPTRSVLEIYEDVRSIFTEGMDQNTMQSFLQDFPS